MSKKLATIRKKIDTLDNAIHDVLMERASLISTISEEKAKYNLDYVQPAREAQMIRRLLKRHKGVLPQETIVRIWRELVGSVSLLQTGLNVTAYIDDEQDFKYWDTIRNYFGSVVSIDASSSPLLTLASLRENTAAFAVLPWPKDMTEEADKLPTLPWWASLLDQEQNKDIKIVCALPYGVHNQNDGSKITPTQALILSKSSFISSDEDNSFILVDLNRNTSRARIVDALNNVDLTPISIHTSHAMEPSRALHIIEIEGYVTQENEHLTTFQNTFDDPEMRCLCIGGYPVPPVF